MSGELTGPVSLAGVSYEHHDHTVILVDLPQLLEQAQHTSRKLLCKEAPPSPFQTPEPQGRKRDLLLLQRSSETLEFEHAVERECVDALSVLASSYSETAYCWSHPIRRLMVNSKSASQSGLSESLFADIDLAGLAPILLQEPRVSLEPIQMSGCVLSNPTDRSCKLQCGDDAYHIPPSSTFLQSSIQVGLASFREATNLLLPKNHAGFFDLILLDPPWENRSVRRISSYLTGRVSGGFDIFTIMPMLQDLSNEDTLIAIWITNKESIRTSVMAAMKHYGFGLIARWSWLKIAANGEPLYPLHGLWRKPYEILLLFRQGEHPVQLDNRVIVGVPNEHSQKPCLKALFEPLLPQPYQALELFARNLVAGWWSIGDEVLKFQHTSYWID